MRKIISRIVVFMASAASLLSVNAALAQTGWNLQVTDTTSTTIEVSWTFPTGVTQALVTLRDADGNQLNAFGPLFSTSRTFTGLLINTTYRISVAQLGDATNSAEITARTGNSYNVRVTRSTTSSISLAWNFSDDEATFDLSWVNTADSTDSGGDSTNTISYTITGLTADNEYEISLSTTVSADTVALATIRAVARDWVPPSPKKGGGSAPAVPPTPRPPANTCPNLLPDIVVSGYVAYGSQCQVVAGAGVGRQDLLDRGVVSAVDIWSLVPSGVEVCFRNMGAAVVFLDAAYSPRLLSALEYTARDGHTCAMINTAGTVVLLAS